jgi:pimeloyl-ACP methyl ester carboxylesterase
MRLTAILCLLLAACSEGESGTITWSPCSLDPSANDMRAECARVIVPLDWSHPKAGQVSVAVKRLPATEPRVQLWLVEGGPGASGLADFPEVMARWQAQDPGIEVYTLDHRGVGESERLSCPSQEDPSSVDGTAISSAEIAACLASLERQRPGALAHFNTTQAAHDLAELVRRTSRAGVPSFLWGASYGTYLLQRYLQIYPRQVTGVIVDSLNPADADAQTQAAGMNQAGRDLLGVCAGQPRCAERLGGDPLAFWKALLADLDRGHCAAAGGDGAAVRALASFVGSYHPLRQVLPALAYRLRRCNAADLLALGHFTAIMDGDWFTELPGFSQVLNTNIVLSEMSEPRQAAHAADESDRLFAISNMADVRSLRQHWPVYEDPLDDQWASADVPILMLQGRLDFLTPAGPARAWSDHFAGPGQTYVEFPEGAHGLTFATPTPEGTDCAAQLILSFLRTPTAPPDTTCVKRVLRLDFEGDSATAAALLGTSNLWD